MQCNIDLKRTMYIVLCSAHCTLLSARHTLLSAVCTFSALPQAEHVFGFSLQGKESAGSASQVSQVSSPGNCCLINKQVDPIQSHPKESASSASQVSSTGNAKLLLYDSTGVFSGSLWDPIIINKLSLNLWQNQKVSTRSLVVTRTLSWRWTLWCCLMVEEGGSRSGQFYSPDGRRTL